MEMSCQGCTTGMTASSCAMLSASSPFPGDGQDPQPRYLPQLQQASCSVPLPPADFGSCERSGLLSESVLALSDWERWIRTAQGYQTAPSGQALPAHALRHGGPRLKCCQTSRVIISLEGQWPLSLWKRATFQDRQDVPDWG